jgi:hypothetical protein
MIVKVMFLDESGDHSLTVIDPQYPLFVLGGVIVDADYAEDELTERVRQFKLELFGRDDLILHTADIARNKNGFEALADAELRERFYAELNALMSDLQYTVVACAVRKEAHLGRYGMHAVDPYLLSLDVLVDRFCFEIGDVEAGGRIVAEKRDAALDRQLDLAWLNLKIGGTRFMQAVDVDRRIVSLTLQSKSSNSAGLQLADLIVSPIGRHVLGKEPKNDWAIIQGKLRAYRGAYVGAGLVVLPRKEKK